MRNRLGIRYFQRHPARFFLLAVPVFLCVCLLYCLHSVIDSHYLLQYNAYVEPRRAMTSIQASSDLISGETLQAVAAFEQTDKVIPCVLAYTNMERVLSPIGVRVHFLLEADMPEALERMNLSLGEGRLPLPGEGEILLHETVLRNKGLDVGGWIGNEVQPGEALSGAYRIVGTLQGAAVACFAPLETWLSANSRTDALSFGLMVYPREGRLPALNQALQYLPMPGNTLSSFQVNRESFEKSAGNVSLLLNAISLSVLGIVCLCMGFLTYLFSQGRVREFGLLRVFGIPKDAILRTMALEHACIGALSTALGVGVSMGLCALLRQPILERMGSWLAIWSGRSLVFALCVPVICLIVQMGTLASTFNRIEIVDLFDRESGGVR